jgi:aquaporin Z
VVALVLEHLDRAPIGLFTGKITAPLQNQDSRTTWGQTLGQRAASGPCTDNDNIEGFVRHAKTVSRQGGRLFRLALILVASCFAGFGLLRAGGVQITSIQETVSNGEKLSSFYTDVLEFKRMGATEVPEGTLITLRLGEETLLLFAPAHVGRPIPADMTSNDLGFQHLAIVVSDIDAAYQRLLDHGVTIVSSGPQTLPDSNYDAAQTRALYFRDPDGHFLELIQFPSNKGEPKWHDGERLFLGIDHSAIAVRDTKESRDFYRDQLGLTNLGDSLNYGIEQERLSGVAGARVEITSFKGAKGPGIELLQYKEPGLHERDLADESPNDLLHWQINLQGTPKGAGAGEIRDPNGHALSVNPRRNSSELKIAGEALRLHWTRYLMEGAELGIFMVVALYLTILLEHPHSFLRRKLKSDLLRRFVLGIGIGSTVVLLIYCQWGRQSGAQFNPAVTLARLSLSRIEPWDAFFYIVAQFIGGWLLLAIAGLPFRHKANHDDVNWVVTEPGETGTVAAFVAEFFISFLIFFSLLVTYHSPVLRPWIGFVAGVHLCLFITFEAPFSGMSLNPARTVASAVPARSWMALWLYFVAPPVAMYLAAQLCRRLFDS